MGQLEEQNSVIQLWKDELRKRELELEEYQMGLVRLTNRVASAKRALEAIEAAFENDYSSSKPGPYSNHEGTRIHMDSRSGGAGHFIEVKNGYFTCSCPAYRFGRTCWALKYIMEQADRGGSYLPFVYSLSKNEWDRRIRPLDYAYPRIPQQYMAV